MPIKMVRAIFWSLILLIPVMLYYNVQGRRPPQLNTSQELFQGITYERRARTSPRPVMFHIMTIDLQIPGVKPLVTPNASTIDPTRPQQLPTQARRTHDFLNEFGLQLAINANYFSKFREHTLWDFYPQSGDLVYVSGEAISNGDRYGVPRRYRPAICFRHPSTQGTYIAQIDLDGTCPSNTEQAVSGREVLVKNGVVRPKLSTQRNGKPYARTAVGVSQTGQTVWLVVVDGKQPAYSEGVSIAELAAVFEELGAERAIALDGGGSVTLAADVNAESTVLNAPIHTKWPMRERPVANHLGFYAQPIQAAQSLEP
ncbi:MAG: phosphodiester glycosidase family protein [Cyanobacteria bacterium J06626_14]